MEGPDRIAAGKWPAAQVEELIGALEQELISTDDRLIKAGSFSTEHHEADWKESTALLVPSFDSALAHLESGEAEDLIQARAGLESALSLRTRVLDEPEE